MATKKDNINLQNIPDSAKVCPKPIQTPALNTSNGDRAIKETNYGPAEGKSACGNCALFDVSSRIRKCTGESSKIGYCWANHFECESKNTCDVWEEGGPIVEDGESYVLQLVNEDAALSDNPYEGEDLNRPQQEEVVEEPMQQQQVEMMQPQMNQQMPPQDMMPPQGQQPMMPPMEQPMMAYGGHLPRAQMGNWFSNSLSQLKDYASDKYTQAKDYATQQYDTAKEKWDELDYTNTDFYKKGQKILDYGQDALSMAGMAPVVGAIPDALNAAISGYRTAGSAALGDTDATKKNAENLAWNTMAIVPGAGQAATTAKFTKRAIQNAPDLMRNFAKTHNAADTTENIVENVTDATTTPITVNESPEEAAEQPLVTRDGYELRRANKGLDGFYGYDSPTTGSPYAGSPLANLLTFPHWSATLNLGSGSGSKEEYKPVEKIGDKNVFYNEETGQYESELDYKTRTGKDYYDKLHEENPDYFGQVEDYNANAEKIIYSSEEEANKIGSKALRDNPESQAIAYQIDDEGNFKFSAANFNEDSKQWSLTTPNTWTAQYEDTVNKLKEFYPDYNPDDYRFVSKSGEYAYPNQGNQFNTYWNNYYLNDPYRAYEQIKAEGGELPLAKNGYHMSYHNRGKTHGRRYKGGYNPYSIPAGGQWETVQHGTNEPKWDETEGWREDGAGNEYWTINRDESRKWLRGHSYLLDDLKDHQKQQFQQHLYWGSPLKFKKWTNPQGKNMIIIEARGDRIYIPADSKLGQLGPEGFNDIKRKTEGSYGHLSTPFADHKKRPGPRTDEEKQLEYDWRNTPYQQEYRIGKDGRTWGGWKYNGEDRDMTYQFRDIDLRTLPYKLQQKYRISPKSRLTKDARTGKIYVFNEGKHSPTIQYDDLKWFNNPGRLGDVQTDPSFGKGDNVFDYLNNPDFQYGQKYEDIDLEKIAKKDHNKFMWDVKQEAKKIEEEDAKRSEEYFKKNPWRIKEIEEEEEEDEKFTIFDPKSKETPVIPNIQDVILEENLDDEKNNKIKSKIIDNKHTEEIWKPVTDALQLSASTGSKNVSSNITTSAANAITKAYQTGLLNGQKYGDQDLERDLRMYGDAYGNENLNKLRSHLGLPTSKYGSELATYARRGTGDTGWNYYGRETPWTGKYTDEDWYDGPRMDFNQEDLDILSNAANYTVHAYDKRGKERRQGRTPENPMGNWEYYNKHADDFMAFKEVVERNSGQTFTDDQIHDMAYAFKRSGTRGGRRDNPFFGENVPISSDYLKNPEEAWAQYSSYGDQRMNEILAENPGIQFVDGTVTNPEEMVTNTEENVVTDASNTDTSNVNTSNTNESSSNTFPTSEEYDKFAIRDAKANQYQQIIDENEEPEYDSDEYWAAKKAKRAAMFASTGTEMYPARREFHDQAEMAQDTPRYHHIESIARGGRELPKAQMNIQNQAMMDRIWTPDVEDPFNFSSGIIPDYSTGLGLNMNSNSILNENNKYELPPANELMGTYLRNQYEEENPDLIGAPTFQDLKEKVAEGTRIKTELDESGTPTPNPQAQFTEFMDASNAMKNKNDYSQLTDEERKQLEQHQKENAPEEEDDVSALDAFAAVSSDIVGLAQGVINPALEEKDAHDKLMEKYKKSSDDIYSASATTQGIDPMGGGVDTIHQDIDYGTIESAKYGNEMFEEEEIEIDEELYRKLIAAGADIEIL